MPATQPPRRSTRIKAPNKHYSVDAFQGLEILSSSDEAQRPKRHRRSNQREDEDDASDGDFEAEKAAELEEQDDLQDDAEDSVSATSDQSPTATPGKAEDADGALPPSGLSKQARVARLEESSGTSVPMPARKWRWTQTTLPLDQHTRGLGNKLSRSNRNRLFIEVYGKDDYEAIGKAADKWLSVLTFPTQKASHGSGGLAYPVGFKDGIHQSLNEQSRPYFPEHEELSRAPKMQALETLPQTDAARFLPTNPPPIRLIMGPAKSQRRYQLNYNDIISLDYAFGSQSSVEASAIGTDSVMRKGWLLHVGGRIMSVSWAPARLGALQYLAVAVEQKAAGSQVPHTPFVASPPYPASLQIWEFPNPCSSDKSSRDSVWRGLPKLTHVICNKWGGARQVKWSPGVPATSRQEISEEQIIGFLAGIWTDGYIRVIEVKAPLSQSDAAVQCKTAFFESRPPDTVCTCLDWLSPTDLAAGCANGFVAIWNLPSSLKDHQSSASSKIPHSTRPYFYQGLSDTYINHIASAGPNWPYLMHIMSVSGYQTLTDLRDPAVESINTLRSRLYQSSSSYSPHMQVFMSTDEQGELIALYLRRFHNSKRIAPTTAGPVGGAVVATSPVHCSVLFGTPDGIVACTNPVRRQVDAKRLLAYSQKWFVHEWRQIQTGEGEQDGASVSRSGLRAGTVRISEGHKVDIVQNMSRNRGVDEPTTTFEEEQAITALSWNPNLECGGWAVAGMGSGLIRIEDLAL